MNCPAPAAGAIRLDRDLAVLSRAICVTAWCRVAAAARDYGVVAAGRSAG